MNLDRRQLILLAALTLVWGLNWPVMKVGVTGYPPFAFRAISLWLGLPVLAGVLVALRQPFHVPRVHWRELFWLAVTNMFIWQALAMVAVVNLSSGRAAILGYSMPIFSAMLGVMFYGERLSLRHVLGVLAASLGVVFLLWHEATVLSGKPWGVLCALGAAASWALGTRQMRVTRMPVSTLTLSFWMTAMTGVVLSALSVLLERPAWGWPPLASWGAIAFNAVLVLGIATPIYLYLARSLPPVAASLSVMMIPIVGVFGGALWLGEVLHWQDWAAVVLMVLAMASVLLPTRASPVAG